jgi:hypothetical protein
MEIGGIPESIESMNLELENMYSLVKPVKTI